APSRRPARGLAARKLGNNGPSFRRSFREPTHRRAQLLDTRRIFLIREELAQRQLYFTARRLQARLDDAPRYRLLRELVPANVVRPLARPNGPQLPYQPERRAP